MRRADSMFIFIKKRGVRPPDLSLFRLCVYIYVHSGTQRYCRQNGVFAQFQNRLQHAHQDNAEMEKQDSQPVELKSQSVGFVAIEIDLRQPYRELFHIVCIEYAGAGKSVCPRESAPQKAHGYKCRVELHRRRQILRDKSQDNRCDRDCDKT